MEAPDQAVDTNEENLRALEEGRFDDLRFDVVARGYRQDQVDALLAAVERSQGTAPVASDDPADDSAEPSTAGVATSLPLSAEKGLD